MTKVLFKVEFQSIGNENDKTKKSINDKISDKIIDYGTVPRIGEWVDLLEIARNYDLSREELGWLSSNEHKFRIENVNKCDGYIESELDTDKNWPEEA